MPYTPELKELIKTVERTRPERVARKRDGGEFAMMSLDERQAILERYHPDHRGQGRRPLRVGANKGYAIPDEFADLFEARSRVEPDVVDLSAADIETDVLVIGAGGAGTAAALLAEEQGASVVIATKLRHGDANTMMAEGGIQAATKTEKDSPYFHYLDVIGGGHFKSTPELVRTLVTQAPDVLSWLEDLGMMFDKEPDGRMNSIHGGGTSRKRMHSAGDVTGMEIMRTIRDEARNRGKITVVEFVPAVELLLDETGRCGGALFYNLDTEEYFVVKAAATVLAAGGSGRLHIQGFMTTNHYGATGDGLVIGYRAGVEVCYLHTVQYHPTGSVFPEQTEGLLITEKFRGAGANLVNVNGEQFVNEREPRDVESAACIRECLDRALGVATPTGKLGVWLDSPMIDQLSGKGTVRREFPEPERDDYAVALPDGEAVEGFTALTPEGEKEYKRARIVAIARQENEIRFSVHCLAIIADENERDALIKKYRQTFIEYGQHADLAPGIPEWESIVNFCLITSRKEADDILAIAQSRAPLVADEVLDGISFFRYDLSGDANSGSDREPVTSDAASAEPDTT